MCRFREARCNACGKTGHIARVCRSVGASTSNTELRAIASVQPAEYLDSVRMIDSLNAVKVPSKHMIDVSLEDKLIPMEIDTGAPCGIISNNTFRKIKPKCKLEKTVRKFVSYTGHSIPCISSARVNVTVGQTTRKLDIFIVKGRFDSLFGREWIAAFVHEIDFVKLFSSSNVVNSISMNTPCLSQDQEAQLDQLLMKYSGIFNTTAGTLTGSPVSVHLKQDATPIFSRAREIPIALRDKYAKAIDEKINAGFY